MNYKTINLDGEKIKIPIVDEDEFEVNNIEPEKLEKTMEIDIDDIMEKESEC